jgi:repressor of nif and glnA expression
MATSDTDVIEGNETERAVRWRAETLERAGYVVRARYREAASTEQAPRDIQERHR